MRDILLKEINLSASPLAFWFIAFGALFLLPGYPILCGAFFVTLGLFQSFQAAREANDIVFSALLPIAKREVVKGKFLFVSLVELCGLALMALATILRMTVLAQAAPYVNNALMNANPFALGAALVIFALFNLVFLGGFFKTAYRLGRPFVAYTLSAFAAVVVFEALHHFPGLGWLNAFGREYLGRQLGLLAAGLASFASLTALACRRAGKSFEKIDL